MSGLTVDQANNRIREKIGKRFSSSNIRLSVGQTHTIMVNVVGEVKTPGTYTLSAFATVFNALYMAGGIGDLGTRATSRFIEEEHSSLRLTYTTSFVAVI